MFIDQVRTDSPKYMEQYKEIVSKLGGIWAEDKIYFSKSNFYFWASYKPQYPYNSSGDIHILWNKNENEISISIPEYADGPLEKLYKKNAKDMYMNHLLKKYVPNYEILDELLYDQKNKKSILLNNLKNIDKSDFEQIMIREINAIDNDTSRVLNHLYDIILNCKTDAELDCVDKTVIAITGWNIESLIQLINEKEKEI